MTQATPHVITGDEPLEQAILRHRSGELDSAEQLYRTILAQSPDDAQCIDLLSTLNRQRCRFDMALELSQRAVSIRPGSPLYLFNLGECHRAAGQPREAVEAYRKSIEFGGDRTEVYLGLGQALATVGMDSEAEAAFRQAAKLRPPNVKAWDCLAVCLIRRRSFDEAESACHESIRLAPSSAAARGRLGAVLAAKGDLKHAELEFREAIALRPDWPLPYVELARVLNLLFEPREAA